MAEEPVANKTQPPSDEVDAEYDRIYATLAETTAGRRFLEEYARRSRPADTEASLAAIEHIQAVIRAGGASERLRLLSEMAEMAEAITRVRAEIVALRPPSGHIETTESLDWIVRATESATSRILAATEEVQETAWALRESGTSLTACDRLDGLATEIYTACTFQDLTGQRTRKVTNVLRDLEERLNAIVSTSKLADETAADNPDLVQSDVDAMMAPEPPEEERQEATLEDIGRFMQALEPLKAMHEETIAVSAALPDGVVTADDVKPELSVAEAVTEEAVEVRTEWAVEPATSVTPKQIIEEGMADWVVEDPLTPQPEAEPEWMILRRLETEIDASDVLESVKALPHETQARDPLLPPAEMGLPEATNRHGPVTELETADLKLSPSYEAPRPAEKQTQQKTTARSAGLLRNDDDDFPFDNQASAWSLPPSSPRESGSLPESALVTPRHSSSSAVEASTTRAPYDPLAPIRAMSDEQKIALFS